MKAEVEDVKTRKFEALFLVVVVLSIYAFGADFWENKVYTEWSEKDCNKMLTKSPWAFSNRFRRVQNLGSVETGERETAEIIEFRLLSAKPIRAAFAQLQLLQHQGNEGLKAQIDEHVNASVGDKILVQISYRAEPASSGRLQDLHAFFGRANLATFHGNTYLASSDVLNVAISEYLPWNPQRPNAVFVFPRYDENGKPYFTGEEKTISLRSEFKTSPVERSEPGMPSFGTTKYKIYIKMKPKDMVFEGEFAI